MNDARRVAVLAALTRCRGAGVGLRPAAHSHTGAPGQSLIVLLPDPAVARSAARPSRTRRERRPGQRRGTRPQVSTNQPPGPVTTMSEAEVQRLFGAALSALPPPPQHFTLYFRFESDELTDESRALVPEMLQAVRARPVPDVVVVGHTDTTGTLPATSSSG